MEKLEFETDNLNGYNIENKLKKFYDLGCVHSSNFMEIEVGIGNRYVIIGDKKDIEFSCTVGKTKNDKYLVMINPIRITRK